MAYPDLFSGEAFILQAHNVKVKSVSFEAVLTNRRLVLVDSKNKGIPPQEISLATIRSLDAGENAIRDPILTLSVITTAGTIRQMILTFSSHAGGERRRERDEWIRNLKEYIPLSDQVTVSRPASAAEQETTAKPEAPPAPSGGTAGKAPVKKKIEIARPMKKIMESAPVMPTPVETSSLPQGSFCTRCGNRVPPESVFCNRCGTAVSGSAEQSVSSGPVVPQVPVLPVNGEQAEPKERPLEEIIHSIEPLISDSVPRSTEPAPVVPRVYPIPVTGPAERDVPQTPAGDQVSVPSSDNKSPELPVPDTAPSLPAGPDVSLPVPPPLPPSSIKRPGFVTFAVLIVAVVVLAAGLILVPQFLSGTPGDTGTATPVTTPATPLPSLTPAPTRAPTLLPTPTPVQPAQVIIPPDGVWVRVKYAGKFSGTIGTPGSIYPITDKGDQFYRISTLNGSVEVAVRKMEGSADEMAIEVYKTGNLVKRVTTLAPKGIIEFQVSLKPVASPTSTPS